jgi:putative transposase
MPHRKTCQRFNDPGHAHFLTFSCFRRQPFLAKDRGRQWFVEAVDRARDKHNFHVWAYVVMPEHVHLLIWPTTPAYDVSVILNCMKQSVAQRALIYVRRFAPAFLDRMQDRQPSGAVHYRFWQRGGGYDRNIVEATTLHQIIEYIHTNPVRRGLCQRPEDWLWSSAADYASERVGPLRIDRDELPPLVVANLGRRIPNPRHAVAPPSWPLSWVNETDDLLT